MTRLRYMMGFDFPKMNKRGRTKGLRYEKLTVATAAIFVLRFWGYIVTSLIVMAAFYCGGGWWWFCILRRCRLHNRFFGVCYTCFRGLCLVLRFRFL